MAKSKAPKAETHAEPAQDPKEVTTTHMTTTTAPVVNDETRVAFNFGGTLGLRKAVILAAHEAGLNESDFCRKAIAEAVGYDLTPMASRAGRGMTDEQKQARKLEQQAAAKAKRDETKAQLAEILKSVNANGTA